MLKPVLKIDVHIQVRQLAQVERRVTMQNLEIKAQMVETDHEIGPLKFGEKIVHLLLIVNAVTPALCYR